jgi:four helix bundle protein
LGIGGQGLGISTAEEAVKIYKELEVWQKALDLTTEIYKLTHHFPDQEKIGLTVQIRRAAVSVAANIAEGWGRGTTKEYIQFLLVSRGSVMELEIHGIIARRLGYLSEAQIVGLQTMVDEIGRMLNGLIQSLRDRQVARRSPTPNP